MRILFLAAALMISGGIFLTLDKQNPSDSTTPKDLMSEFYENNRISTVLALEEFYTKNMDVKDPDSFEWLAKTLQEKAIEDRRELDRYIGGKIADDQIESLIEDIKNYEVGKDRTSVE